ncbi:phage major capsid protein [Hyalangium sp.]|uniref:phage major capsid protein n=1 Tax=Hyalangium sp. TaxID=2028555 RepID=UPI002D666AE2|nr:phage major capsid protein [Hyalangium sp.]HYI01556.1 phage major capsid protein [Hyalangium sp.]
MKLRLPSGMSKAINAAVAQRVAEEMAARNQGAPANGQKANGQGKVDFRHAIGVRVKSLYVNSPLNQVPAALRDAVNKAASMYEGVYGQGGSLLKEEYSSEIIPLLRPRAVLLRAGAIVQPFTGKMNIGRLNGGAVAAFVKEGGSVTPATYSTDAVILDGHKIMALADPSNDMLRNPDIDSAGIITDDLMSAIAVVVDAKGFLGDGSGANPKGIVKLLATDQKVTGTAITSANALVVIARLNSMQQKVKASNLPFEGNAPFWAFNSRTEFALRGLRDNAGYIFNDEMNQGRLQGHPFFSTENVPDGYIFFGLATQLYFGLERGTGEGGTPEITMGAPDFKNDLTSFKAVMKCDWKLKYDTAFSYASDFTYS